MPLPKHTLVLIFLIFMLLISKNVEGKEAKPCIDCHSAETLHWQQSDHAKAMALASEKSVLADFANAKVTHYGQTARFFIEQGKYLVDIGYDSKQVTYRIKYTFGHFPLQQYLVEIEPGRIQVLPFAWDSRKKSEGGQRWYHIYSNEEIRPKDRLHWLQPLQNWNGMCADCHSDGLIRNYDHNNNNFDSKFSNINIGCVSCHGETVHKQTKMTIRNPISKPLGKWLRDLGNKTAHWQGEKRDNSFMDNCFSCHSLRSPLTDGFKANTAFLDQFTPQLPATPLYYADGQIKEEVYVYGSFLQSKMFKAGVNCLDCHDKHTMKIKIQGNGLCLQCHSGEEYEAIKHHQHERNSNGSLCINCHMPQNRYMGVDDRRDHSFSIPRPDISIQFNTPNACIKCHQDKSNQWASNYLRQKHGQPTPLTPAKQLWIKLNAGQAISLEQHLSIIADKELNAILRASAIQLLPYTVNKLPLQQLAPYFTDKEALIRLAVTTLGPMLPISARQKYITPLLNDRYKSVRVAAAKSLISVEIAQRHLKDFQIAFSELNQAQIVNSWRGEGIMNQAQLSMELNNVPLAEKQLKQAIDIDPFFEPGYINLSDLYRATQRPMQTYSVLQKGLNNLPKSDVLHYSMGLHFVRQQRIDKALKSFKNSIELAPDNAYYAYTYILAIDSSGETAKALSTLEKVIANYSDKVELNKLKTYLLQKL